MSRVTSINSKPKLLRAAARTIGLSFSADPLIKWLRPSAPTWSELDADSLKWQERRLLRANANAIMIGILPEPHNESKGSLQSEAALETSPATVLSSDTLNAFDGVAIFYPVSPLYKLAWSRLIARVKLWFADLLYPVTDIGAIEARVQTMMEGHATASKEIESKLGQRVGYLEVVAVHPEQQGRGIGGLLLQEVLSQIGSKPIFLECTSSETVPFYEKFGFKVVEEVVLSSAREERGEELRLWLMLRE